MKKTILIASLVLTNGIILAQEWELDGNTGTDPAVDYVGTDGPEDLSFRTDANIRMQLESTGELGLGTTTPAAWFHILTNGSGNVNAKEAFRTDVPSGSDTYWRMYRNGSEYFRLINFTGTNALYIQAPRGHLRLASGDGGNAIESFEIIGGSGSDAGFVGIGDYSSFTAQRLLDVYSSSNAPQFRILI